MLQPGKVRVEGLRVKVALLGKLLGVMVARFATNGPVAVPR